MVFQRILVALDQSFQAPFVFEKAVEQVRTETAQLMILHTVSTEPNIQSGALLGIGTLMDVNTYGTVNQLQRERLQKDIRKAEAWLRPYAEQAMSQGITTELECKAGQPATQICELAKTWEADLIVLGRRGHQGVKEVVLGSVSNYVVHHATCSVLVVQ